MIVYKENTRLHCDDIVRMWRSEAVESCDRWADSTTQQVDLAFNIFFMIYFFIRVTHDNPASTACELDWWNFGLSGELRSHLLTLMSPSTSKDQHS